MRKRPCRCSWRRFAGRPPCNARAFFKARGARLAEDHQQSLEQSRTAAAVGWDAQPITTARLCAELYEKIRNEDWALCNGTVFQNYWPQQLWTATHHYQYIGDAGAYGLGYLPGASVGAALAHRKHGRLAVAIGGDGDLMFSPGALWTAAHHRIPLLYVVHNNRAYHQELMFVQSMALKRQRGIDRAHIGNTITDPNVDFAKLAAGLGVYSEGPIDESEPTWVRRWSGPLPSSNQASRRWSMSLPRDAREVRVQTNILVASLLWTSWSVLAFASEPHGNPVDGQASVPGIRLLPMPRYHGRGRRSGRTEARTKPVAAGGGAKRSCVPLPAGCPCTRLLWSRTQRLSPSSPIFRAFRTADRRRHSDSQSLARVCRGIALASTPKAGLQSAMYFMFSLQTLSKLKPQGNRL